MNFERSSLPRQVSVSGTGRSAPAQSAGSVTWARMQRLRRRWLPSAIVHPYPDPPLDGRTRGKSPVREIRPLGYLEGARGLAFPLTPPAAGLHIDDASARHVSALTRWWSA